MDLQPVTGVGGEERTAEHQDAAQDAVFGHLEMVGVEWKPQRDQIIPRR